MVVTPTHFLFRRRTFTFCLALPLKGRLRQSSIFQILFIFFKKQHPENLKYHVKPQWQQCSSNDHHHNWCHHFPHRRRTHHSHKALLWHWSIKRVRTRHTRDPALLWYPWLLQRSTTNILRTCQNVLEERSIQGLKDHCFQCSWKKVVLSMDSIAQVTGCIREGSTYWKDWQKTYESHVPKVLYGNHLKEIDGKKKVQYNLMCDMAKV